MFWAVNRSAFTKTSQLRLFAALNGAPKAPATMGRRWLPMSGGAYMSSPNGATWRSGYATVCKTVYTSSILVVASINIIKYFHTISKKLL
jgi:hypothetical protein